jgi:hypothetical protein
VVRGSAGFAIVALLAPAAWADGTPLASDRPSTVPQAPSPAVTHTHSGEPGAAASSDATHALARIARCESGGNPSAVGPGGHRGKYQFDPDTWKALGGTGDPASAPEAEQDRLAAKLYAQSGSSPWASCAGSDVQLTELARTNGLPPPPPPGGNGRLPFSQEVPIHSPRGRAYLAPGAARAWEAMRQASLRELGVDLYPLGPDSAYRSYRKQVEAWRLFKSGGPEARPPGTSAHGLGKAVDLASFEMRKAVDRLGPRFGWAKTEAPSEWGHVNYVGG